MAQHSEMTLFDSSGQRLYLTPEERKRFAEAATKHSITNEARTFCRMLYYTGCRPSEALQLTSDRINFAENSVVLRSLKKRKDANGNPRPVFRSVPLPDSFLDELNLVHNIKDAKHPVSLWPWSRATGWTRVKEVMAVADIEGVHATCKGLRHGFGVAHAMKKTALPSISKWLGHEDIKTTAIYLQVCGEEERALAAAVWD